MIKRRKNFSNKLGKDYKSRVSGSPEDMYSQWHWGVKPNATPVEIKDADYPDVLLECGRLVSFTYRKPRQNPKHRDKEYKLGKTSSNNTHLVFDPSHHNDRMYVASTSKKWMEQAKQDFYKTSPYQETSISNMSYFVGGKHAGEDYPEVKARVIGVLTSIVYACDKEGDGYSFYVHKMGEESGVQPIIAVDKKGRIWIVGGNYTAPIQGITD